MDYRSYKNLMERYHKLSEFTPDQNETEEGLIKKLMDIACEKNRFQTRQTILSGNISRSMKRI